MIFTIKKIEYNTDDNDLFEKLRINRVNVTHLKDSKAKYLAPKYKEYCEQHDTCLICKKIFNNKDLIIKNKSKVCKDHLEEYSQWVKSVQNKSTQTRLTRTTIKINNIEYDFNNDDVYYNLLKNDICPAHIPERYQEAYNNYKNQFYKCHFCGEIYDKNKINDKIARYCDNCEESYIEWTNKKHDKIKQTKLERYGDENFTNREKAKETFLEKYGVEFPLLNPDINKQTHLTKIERYGSLSYNNIEKTKQTKLERYGSETYNNTEKFKQTCLEKYGVEYYPQAPEFVEKVKQTKLERYGDENYINVEKIKQTCLERYGVENASQAEEIKEKIKQTCLERYGFEHTLQVPEIREQIKQTNLEKYGFEYPTQSDIVKDKTKQTNLENYGVEYPIQSEEMKEKIKEINLEKYGFEYPIQSQIIKDKIIQDNLKKYGVRHPSQMHIKNYENYNEEYIRENFIKDGYFLKDEFANYFGINLLHASTKVKEKLNITEPNKTEKHKTQNYIFDSIKTDNKLLNDRSLGFELDIHLPDYKLAVEYNGLLYHSQGYSIYSMINTPNFDPNYHLNKTLECKKNGITLFHIFEGEDIDLWLSMINNKLGLNNKIFARKCIIKELNYNEVKDFLDNNHLQKSCVSNINIGLFYNNELVQVMTFSKPRFNKNYEYELIRLCSLKNTNVVGGASKLLSYFIKKYKPKNIISYANRRFSNGTIYEKLGFTLVRETNPNYFYWKPNYGLKLETRNKYQKHKLSKLLVNYDENLSEAQNMFNNGYRRIFDCGNLVYEMKLN